MTDPAITAVRLPLFDGWVAGGGGGKLVCAVGDEVLEPPDEAEDVEDGAEDVVVAEELAGRLGLLVSSLLAGGCSI